METLEFVAAEDVREAARRILAHHKRTLCHRCGGEIEIRLRGRVPKPNPVAPLLKEMGIREPRFGPNKWFEVEALVCRGCGIELEPYEEIRMLNLGVTYGSLKGPREAYTDRKGRLRTRVPRRISWRQRREHPFNPKVCRFHQKVQGWLRQNFRLCPDCGGHIDYRWESRRGEIKTSYFNQRPGAIGVKLPPKPECYDVVVSIFCRGECRRRFPLPEEVVALNEEAAEKAQKVHFAPRPQAQSSNAAPGKPRPPLVRPQRLQDLTCRCPGFCLLHTKIRVGV